MLDKYLENKKLIICIALLIIAYFALYFNWIHSLIFKRWNTEDYSYCYLIPFIAGYLTWDLREKFRFLPAGSPVVGYIFLFFAGICFFIGRLGSLETFIYLSMWLAFVGGVGLLFGSRALKEFWFPLIILAFIIPAPPFITRLMSFRLQLLSSKIGAALLHLVGIPVFREGNVLDLGITKLQVVEACSGLRYIIPVFIVTLIIGYLNNKRLSQFFLLLILSLPIAALSNGLRLFATALGVLYISPAFAGEGFLHEFMGFVFFLISIIIILGISFILKKIWNKEKVKDVAKETSFNPKLSRKKYNFFIHGIVACVFFAAMYFVPSTLLSSQIIPKRNSFDSFPMQINNWVGQREYLSERILKSLWADDYISATFYNVNTGNRLHLLISYYKHQTALHTAHAPLSCLLGGGYSLVSKKTLSPDKQEGRNFPVTQLILRKENIEILSNFWFQGRGRVITNEYLNKLYLFWDAITMRRTDGALIRVEMVVNTNQNIISAQKVLNSFVGPLKDILKKDRYLPD